MKVVDIPAAELPAIDELSGDLRVVAEIVGVAKALEIGQRFHGVQINLWNVRKFILRHRNRCMLKDFEDGLSGRALALKYQMSERQVWRILGQPIAESRQMGLW